MSRRRSTSSSHNQCSLNLIHKPCNNYQRDQTNRITSELCKQACQTLIYNDDYHENKIQNSTISHEHPISPPHRNNFKPVDSPLRRPHLTTENESSDLDDIIHDPRTKTVYNNRNNKKKIKNE
ncbi:unnamed protein product [Rotaria sp. Silwood1]|nr:unnamed protein product [Rotaria sp. Silwood1]